jgi:hypothetical protein
MQAQGGIVDALIGKVIESINAYPHDHYAIIVCTDGCAYEIGGINAHVEVIGDVAELLGQQVTETHESDWFVSDSSIYGDEDEGNGTRFAVFTLFADVGQIEISTYQDVSTWTMPKPVAFTQCGKE